MYQAVPPTMTRVVDRPSPSGELRLADVAGDQDDGGQAGAGPARTAVPAAHPHAVQAVVGGGKDFDRLRRAELAARGPAGVLDHCPHVHRHSITSGLEVPPREALILLSSGRDRAAIRLER